MAHGITLEMRKIHKHRLDTMESGPGPHHSPAHPAGRHEMCRQRRHNRTMHRHDVGVRKLRLQITRENARTAERYRQMVTGPVQLIVSDGVTYVQRVLELPHREQAHALVTGELPINTVYALAEASALPVPDGPAQRRARQWRQDGPPLELRHADISLMSGQAVDYRGRGA